jgi:hypothetical protein
LFKRLFQSRFKPLDSSKGLTLDDLELHRRFFGRLVLLHFVNSSKTTLMITSSLMEVSECFVQILVDAI